MLCAAALTAAFGGLAALCGTPASAAPAWCEGTGGQRLDTHGGVKDALKHEEPRWELMSLVSRLCKPDPEDREAQPQLEAAMRRWAKRLDVSDAEWSDIASYATLGQSERMSGQISMAPAPGDKDAGFVDPYKRAWTALSPLDQFALIDIDGSSDSILALDDNYLADALGLGLSESGRLAYVLQCLNTDKPKPVAWAMCNRDIERLDLKRVSAELRADKAYSGADKIRIRIRIDELKPRLIEHKAKLKKLIASDPGYAKMFELADATVETWNARYQSHGELLALLSSMEDARVTRSRKALAGCGDKTWEAWKTAVSEIPAAKFEGMHDGSGIRESFLDKAMGPVSSHSSTYLAAVAMMICRVSSSEQGASQDVLIRALGDAVQRWPGYRGPRTETETAIMSAGIELDDRDAALDFPHVYRDFASGGGSHSGGGSGVIAKLKPAGKMATVEFKKQLVKQVQCAVAKSTGRITQIRPDGSLIYETRCVKNETVIVDKSDDPQQVNGIYLEGVKPGMFVTIIEDVATGVWAKPGSAKPTMVFGAPVK